MARGGLACTWRQRYCRLKTNACATKRQWGFARFRVGDGRAFRNVFQTRHQRYWIEMEKSLTAMIGRQMSANKVGLHAGRAICLIPGLGLSASNRYWGLESTACRSCKIFEWGTTGVAPQRAASTP
jgi:hypothetical protein